MKIIVTGGAGFIGSAVVRHILNNTNDEVIVVDKLTYAAHLRTLEPFFNHSRFKFEQIDICDFESVRAVLEKHQPDAILHLAAESHVDRSIDGPSVFIKTNILGTFTMLEASLSYYKKLEGGKKAIFRFHHVSTDEVYGDLHGKNEFFTESTAYAPSSPYSASKASSDHLVRAWFRTFDLPVVVTNCSNNYGPYHFPEKLIPLAIINALSGKPITVYGDGSQIRDWLYVDDHAEALYTVLTKAKVGESYNIGGWNERKNIDVVKTICKILNETVQTKPANIDDFHDLIKFVTDRPGHDARYAIDATKINHDLGWKPKETFESGLKKTVQWFLENQNWWQEILDKSYQDYSFTRDKK